VKSLNPVGVIPNIKGAALPVLCISPEN
jgi:hypothetical protein